MEAHDLAGGDEAEPHALRLGRLEGPEEAGRAGTPGVIPAPLSMISTTARGRPAVPPVKLRTSTLPSGAAASKALSRRLPKASPR